jgi:hypothetical protein
MTISHYDTTNNILNLFKTVIIEYGMLAVCFLLDIFRDRLFTLRLLIKKPKIIDDEPSSDNCYTGVQGIVLIL